jgi:hypothetical protein
MKIFHAIVSSEIVPLFYEKTKIKLNYLVSYHFLRGLAYDLTNRYRKMIDLLYLDSGAYSVSTGKSKINLSEFLKYITRYGNSFDAVFTLDDAFDDPEHNLINQLYLEKGLPPSIKLPIPTVHDPEDPFEELKMYADLGHNYIAIGSNKKLEDEVFEKIKGEYPKLKIHMFGNLNIKMLKKHKPYSADSAGYANKTKHGEILFWHPEEEKEYKVYVGERDRKIDSPVHFNRFKHKGKLEDFLSNTFQLRPQDLYTDYSAKWMVNMYFFKQMEDHINRGQKGSRSA